MPTTPLPFSRLQVPDPATNQAIQDIYNKLAQVSTVLQSIQTQLSKLPSQSAPQDVPPAPLKWNAIAGSLQNGWTVNPDEGPPGYAINTQGTVKMVGALTPGTTADGTTLFTLPTGFRPINRRIMPVVQVSGGSIIAGVVAVSTDGAVKVYGSTGCTELTLDCQFETTGLS